MYGFYRVAAAVPKIVVGDVQYNTQQVISLARKAEAGRAAVAVFPELCLTGYTCGDLFHQSSLIEAVEESLRQICRASKKMNLIMVVGAPLFRNNRLYNCAVVIQNSQILGVVPKAFLPNYKEFYEKRWFTPGYNTHGDIEVNNDIAPFGDSLVFQADKYFIFGAEICEDFWNVIPPSSYHAVAGATVMLNLSASNELVGKAQYRRELVTNQSARCMSGYVYASAGVHESTTDLVYGGHAMIAENGVMLRENKRFEREEDIIFADLDCQRLHYTRVAESSYDDNVTGDYGIIVTGEVNQINEVRRAIDPSPFVPSDLSRRGERCEEIFNIQTAGLAKRLQHAGSAKAVIGVSGGLDSTLALLVVVKTFELLGRDPKDIVAITMPGFGTTDRTYKNAVALCKVLGTDFREISIKKACQQQFRDIGHEPENHDVVFENVQARQRTQVLMNTANQVGGLVVGTGDLSEIALGWSTYNGDHMSMYSVNCSVPKTLIRYLVQWVADQSTDKKKPGRRRSLREMLYDVVDTPISPELLPPCEKGEIQQKTEDVVGPYDLHDFFLYHTVKYGADTPKVCYLAKLAFNGRFSDEEIVRWNGVFVKRFFQQQFKRSCMPDGPKVGSISLSPRGDWRMPSDASPAVWML